MPRLMKVDALTGEWALDDDEADAMLEEQRAAAAPAAAPTLEVERAREIDQLQRWGVSYQDACLITSPAHLKPTPMLRHADRFMVEKGTGAPDDPNGRRKTICVLAGPLGVGKTVAASHLLWNGNPKRQTGAWTSQNAPRMLHVAELLAASKLRGEADEQARKKLERHRILVIDDLGLEEEPIKTYFNWLFDARYGGDGWLVLTTNLTVDDFRGRYGERVYDRLRHRGEWFEVNHESLRKG